MATEKKYDPFESFVRENREDFNVFDPPENLWDKISDRLDQPEQERGRIVRMNWKLIGSRAAAVILIFITSWVVQKQFFSNEKVIVPVENQQLAQERVVNEDVQELIEAEAFYTSEIDKTRKELDQYLKDHPEIVNELKEEFSYLDSAYAGLRSDLNENAANEKVIEAMILNHRMKLEILEEMLIQIKTSELNVNENENETVHI